MQLEELIERLDAFEGSDALGDGDFSVCVEAAQALRDLKASADAMAELLVRYRKETPPGHSPHMICHKVDQALAAYREKFGA